MKTLRLFSLALMATIISMSFVSCSDDDDYDESLTNSISGIINGHEYVDLGLSVKWATCNVGASSINDYGDYYAWGEISTKSSYTEDNSVTYEKDMESIAGDPKYDVARANWGSSWRLPTEEEIEELENKCEFEWTTQRGHNGYKITGPNGNSIFLPAAGYRYGTSLDWDVGEPGELGRYWSATPNDGDTELAYSLIFDRVNFHINKNVRQSGYSVRPISE